MDDKGKLTAWTALLIVTGIILALIGGALAPDGKIYTWLLIGGWLCTSTALGNVYGKVRTAIRESEIREQERQRLGGRPRQDRFPR